jgi:hypothetical protein
MGSKTRKLRKGVDLGAVERANPKLAANMLRENARRALEYAQQCADKADRLDPPATVPIGAEG